MKFEGTFTLEKSYIKGAVCRFHILSLDVKENKKIGSYLMKGYEIINYEKPQLLFYSGLNDQH